MEADTPMNVAGGGSPVRWPNEAPSDTKSIGQMSQRTILRAAGPIRLLSVASVVAAMAISPVLLAGRAGAAQTAPERAHIAGTCGGTVPSGTVIGMGATKDDGGYWIATNYGEVIACGDAPYLGDADTDLNAPIVGFTPTTDDGGYYLVASDGGLFAFGDATFHGSMGGTSLNQPIVGMTVDPATGGYWLVASDGGIFAYDAPFLGSTGAIHLNQPIVGMAASGNGVGYWLVASDGGIFAFDAPFLGSTGAIHLNQPIVGMAADQESAGYWLVASDGGIFAYGAPFLGSTGSISLNRPITGMEANSTGTGYRFVASDGGIFNYGSAFYGSAVEPPAVTQPPGSPPTCSVSLSSATPKEYMGETVTITSNIANYHVLLAKVYTNITVYIGGFSTDANGRAGIMLKITSAPSDRLRWLRWQSGLPLVMRSSPRREAALRRDRVSTSGPRRQSVPLDEVRSVCGQLVGIWPEVSDPSDLPVLLELEEAQPRLGASVGVRELDPARRVDSLSDDLDDLQMPVTWKPFDVESHVAGTDRVLVRGSGVLRTPPLQPEGRRKRPSLWHLPPPSMRPRPRWQLSPLGTLEPGCTDVPPVRRFWKAEPSLR